MAKQQAPKEPLTVASKIKDVLRDAGMRVDGDLVTAISDKVHEMLARAVERCKGNNRNTVRPIDL